MVARDGFERYYTEKIWALIPEIYKTEDGNQRPPDVLRAIVEVIAQQAAVTRRSIDRLWEDQNIETSDDWAVPYIGDLVKNRPLSELDGRGRRVDVARTIFFRRRRGTPILLETLVREIGGWDVAMVEAFRRLARHFHRLDRAPVRVGRFTRTPDGGVADLRSPRASDLVHGPFDEFAHTPDFRRHRGWDGRFNIRKLNFHLYRFVSYEVIDSDPYVLEGFEEPTFTFDPSGRDIALFTRGQVSASSDLPGPIATLTPQRKPFPFSLQDQRDAAAGRCGPPAEWDVRHPIACRLLGDAEYLIQPEHLRILEEETPAPSPTELAALELFVGRLIRSEAKLRTLLEGYGVTFSPAPSWYRLLLRLALSDVSGKWNLYPDSVEVGVRDDDPDDPSPLGLRENVTSGDLSQPDCQPSPSDEGILTIVDPELGRFSWRAVTPTPPPPGTITMGVQLPVSHVATGASVGVDQVAVFGTAGTGNAVDIRDNVNIYEGLGSSTWSPVVNVGAGQLNLASNAGVGDAWSVGSINLSNNATVHGDARTEGGVTLAFGAHVAGTTHDHTSLTLANTTIAATFPSPPPPDITHNSGTLNLTPGSYGNLTGNGGTITLVHGDYTFESMTVQSGVTFSVDTSAGIVRINIKGGLTFRAATTGFAPERVRFAVFGTGTVFLEGSGTPFLGTVVAMNATILIQGSRDYRGAYLAQQVTVQPNGAFHHVAFEEWEDPDGSDTAIPEARTYHYGFSGPVGANPVARDLPAVPPPVDGGREVQGGGALAPLDPTTLLQIEDSRTYTLTLDAAHPVEAAAIQGAGGQRPYIRVSGGVSAAAVLKPTSGAARSFRIEGVWFGSASATLGDWIIEAATPSLDTPDWDEIRLREVTLDPGGVRADGTTIVPLRIVVRGRVRRLVIERSIVGPIEIHQVPEDCAESGLVEELEIRDSIVDATHHDGPAILAGSGKVILDGVTVLGDVTALVLQASNSIVMGELDVLDQEASCFRFSAASPGGSLPRRFESSLEIPIESWMFSSLRFGDAAYAHPSRVAPPAILRGAETTSEMGAFSFLYRPIHLDSVVSKVDEFKPAGLIAQYVFEGEDANTVALRTP